MAVDRSDGGNVQIIDHTLNDLGGVIHALEAQIRIDFASRYGIVILDVASKPLVARARDDEDMVLRVVADRLPHARPDIVWRMTMDIDAVIGEKPGFDDAALTTYSEENSVPGRVFLEWCRRLIAFPLLNPVTLCLMIERFGRKITEGIFRRQIQIDSHGWADMSPMYTCRSAIPCAMSI